jgi:2-oxoglutarate ferredoxin oxidoreductase subunit gamma
MNILFAGDGGQGVQTIASIISEVIFRNKKYRISAIPNFGLEQRGGVSLVFVKISEEEITYPKFSEADVILILSKQSRERVSDYINKNTKVFDIENYSKEILDKVVKQNYNIFLLKELVIFLEKEGILSKKQVYFFLEEKMYKKTNWLDIKKIFS